MNTEREINCQVGLTPTEIRDLKAITGKSTTKAALQEAVEFTIANRKSNGTAK